MTDGTPRVIPGLTPPAPVEIPVVPGLTMRLLDPDRTRRLIESERQEQYDAESKVRIRKAKIRKRAAEKARRMRNMGIYIPKRGPGRPRKEDQPPPRKRGRPKKIVPPHLQTQVETIVHEWGPQKVETRGSITSKLRRLKIDDVAATKLFVRDYEMVGVKLRSMGFDGPGGGGGFGQSFPAAKIDAAKRLYDLRRQIGQASYDLLEAYLCHGYTLEEIHRRGGDQHLVLSALLRRAVQNLADFYTPGRVRVDRTHLAILDLIKDAERHL